MNPPMNPLIQQLIRTSRTEIKEREKLFIENKFNTDRSTFNQMTVDASL